LIENLLLQSNKIEMLGIWCQGLFIDILLYVCSHMTYTSCLKCSSDTFLNDITIDAAFAITVWVDWYCFF